MSDKYEMFLRIINSYNIDTFLDIGCGDGSFAVVVKEKLGANVYGIDISEEAIEKARDKGVKGVALDVDSQDLPYEQEYFDLIFCGEVIEHVFSPDHLLEEIFRTLKPKGVLLLTTPNMASWYNRISLLLGYQLAFSDVSLRYSFGHLLKMGITGHLRLYTLGALIKLLQAYRFGIVNIYGIGINKKLGFGKSHPLITAIANYIFTNPSWNSGILVIAQK